MIFLIQFICNKQADYRQGEEKIMFESWGRSWQLVKASWAVLLSDKELLWFPVISGIVTVLICIVMFIPSVVVSVTLFSTGAGEGVTQVFGFAGLFIFYLVTYTISIYFNTALIGATMIRLDGGDPTMKDGFQIANSRLSKIIGFAAMSATVGVVIRFLQERGGLLGNIVSWLGGIAWNLATFLVIPILVTHDIGPIEAVKRSTALLRETWGEQITGNWSIGGIFAIAYILLVLVGIGLAFFAGAVLESVTGVIAVVSLIVILFVILGIIQGALNGIYQAALYRYAESGIAPDNFDISLIQGAFKEKKKKR